MRLQSTALKLHQNLHAVAVLHIFNDLYWSDILSAFEMAEEYIMELFHGLPLTSIPEDIIRSRNTLLAKRKLKMKF